jgi:CSLREA domain-containing protein
VRIIVVTVGLLLLTAPAAQAHEFRVDSTADARDVRPGDTVCATAVATCTLRAAVQEANATRSPDTVLLPAGRIRLSSAPFPWAGSLLDDDAASGDLDIADTLTVRGAGARKTIIDGGGLDRVFSSGFVTTTVISDLTITNADATGGGKSPEIAMGGAIWNRGTMTLERLRLVGNTADGGGAVFSIPATFITIRDSLLADNTAVEGGAIRFDSGGELVNSTVTGNRLRAPRQSNAALLPDELTGWGGGIDHRGGNDLTIVNSTIVGNHALKGGGGLNSGQGYVPIHEALALGRVRLRNTIIADNTSAKGPANCHVSAQVIESTGHNLASDRSCFLTAAGDLAARDPLLAPLGDGDTRALLTGSPAIDAGSAEGCPSHDQRGVARPQGRGCDIGAFEAQPAARKRKAHRHKRRSNRRGRR